jgi:DNA-binding LacI/PurR family transcriptional regulator
MARSLPSTKHFALARTLRQEFRQMRPGDPVYTVEQIKQRFGVSQATVTRALERLRREGIIHRPAGRARLFISEIGPRALHRVAIIRPTWPSPDYDAITRNLILQGEARGWAFEVYANQNDMEDLDLARAVGDNDGAVLLSTYARVPEHLEGALRRPRKPVVVVREVPDDPLISGVGIDNVQVGNLAVRHLASRGHTRILAVVSEPPSRTAFDRVVGWRQAMGRIGMADRCESMLVTCPVRPTQDSLRITYEYFRRWLADANRPQFTGVFCLDWTGALSVMRALRDDASLLVPQDVSVVAYAGESLLAPYLNPALSAIETDMQAFARETIDMLSNQLEDPHAEPRQIRVPSHVVERGSTRPIGPGVWRDDDAT